MAVTDLARRHRSAELTSSVRAIEVARPGGPQALGIVERSLSAPGPDEVQVRVEAAGVAFGDVFLREGLRRDAPLPAVPGYDVAGRVVGVGVGVEGFAEGDPVVGWTGGSGGYAEAVNLPVRRVVARPVGLRPERAVAVVLNYLTAYHLLHRVAHAGPGARILVHGGGGGVGSALVELGRLAGADMLATVSPAKVEVVRRLGGVPIDYTSSDVRTEVLRHAPGGVDAVMDPLGGRSWRHSLSMLRAGGIVAAYGVSDAMRRGRRAPLRLARVLATGPRPSALGLFRSSRGIAGYTITDVLSEHPEWLASDLDRLLGWLDAGTIAPLIAGTFPLEEAAQAHRALGDGPAGKLVLVCA